jgi:hypothetical protein
MKLDWDEIEKNPDKYARRFEMPKNVVYGPDRYIEGQTEKSKAVFAEESRRLFSKAYEKIKSEGQG